ncbi:type II secretion system F family protein [Methanocaldococcus fervens]|uniref:Type II secretion system F domain protein n=1 Tax=Methanocaldococcus fervens (strain DSM 4213 / JCM 15782 / AG86) TaxID=573064 RepID=C7P5U9_METFA|nr:type II secretion system F family protein [Methanocaldococcus fervens]ACV23931.1 Type II secretion system F domain protein [Methanocaldococcus fervens AG86]
MDFFKNLKNKYYRLAIKLFKMEDEKFDEILLKSGISAISSTYLPVIFLTAIIVGFMIFVMLFIFFNVFYAIFGFLVSVFTIILLGISYPYIVMEEKAKSIDENLPYAFAFISALSAANIPVVEIFNSLSKEGIYGGMSKEAKEIIKDTKIFNYDIITSFLRRARITPSKKLSAVYYNIVASLIVGAEMKNIFHEIHERLMEDRKLELLGAIEKVEILSEFYVIACGMIPLFVVMTVPVASSISAVLQSVSFLGDPMLLPLTFYLWVPIASIIFMGLVYGILPKDFKLNVSLLDVLKEFDEPKIEGIKMKFKWKPVHFITIFFWILSVISFMFFFTKKSIFMFYGEDFLMFGILAAILPFILTSYWQFIIENQKEKYYPIFLNDLTMAVRSGMDIIRAMQVCARTNYGPLTKIVKKMAVQMSWGRPINEVFADLEKTEKSLIAKRIASILKECAVSGGDIKDILTSVTVHAYRLSEMKKEISSRQFIYVVVIYLTFFLYIGTSYIMVHSLLPTLLKNVQGLSVDFYRNYLFQGILIYSIFSGASLGILTERSIIAGIKHVLFMLIVGYLIFKLYIGG